MFKEGQSLQRFSTLPRKASPRSKPPVPPPRKSSVTGTDRSSGKFEDPLEKSRHQPPKSTNSSPNLPLKNPKKHSLSLGERPKHQPPRNTSSFPNLPLRNPSQGQEISKHQPPTSSPNLPKLSESSSQTALKAGENPLYDTIMSKISFSPVPKPRRGGMNRSRSCDQLAQQVMEEEKKGVLLVAAPPPIVPINKEKVSLHSTSSGATISQTTTNSKVAGNSTTLKNLVAEHAKSFPLRVELQEGYMSNNVQHITFSASDLLNIHFLKEQEVIKVQDSNGHIYRIPMHSSVQIGLVYSPVSEAASGGKSKTVKAGDIMAMKDLPRLICATKTVKTSSSAKSTIEDKEVLLVRGISKVPNSKKKKVLNVFSLSKLAEKTLSPDCAGHFSMSASLTQVPLDVFFKYVTSQFPFEAHLYFDPHHFSSTLHDSKIPLTQNIVSVLGREIETSLIASSHFVDTDINVSDSRNIFNIPIDKHLGRMEITIVEFNDIAESNQLYNKTCEIHEKIDLTKVKYYHESPSELVHLTQTALYVKCPNHGKLGVKMILPPWSKPQVQEKKEASSVEDSTSSPKFGRSVGSVGESGMQTDHPPFRKGSHEAASSPVQQKPINQRPHPLAPPSTTASSTGRTEKLSYSSSMGKADIRRHQISSEFPRLPPPVHPSLSSSFSSASSLPTHHGSMMEKASSHGRLTRTSTSDVQVTNSRSSPMKNRPPCPIPTVSSAPPKSPNLSHHHFTSGPPPGLPEHSQTTIHHVYQSPRQVIAATSTSSPFPSTIQEEAPHTALPIAPPSIITKNQAAEVFHDRGLPPRSQPRNPTASTASLLGSRYGEYDKLNKDRSEQDNWKTKSYDTRLQWNSPPSIYQVPKKSGQGPTVITSSAEARQVASPSSSKQEDEVEYEEMRSITRCGLKGMGASSLCPSPRREDNKDDSSGSGGFIDVSNKGRSSFGYGTFDPPVTNKTVTEVKTEIQQLSEKVKDLSEQLVKVEGETLKDLKTSLEQAVERIAKVEEELEKRSAQTSTEDADETPTNLTEKNKEFLRKLSCDQIQKVLEGMSLKQYNGVIKKEVIDGEIILDLDTPTLAEEIGVTSRIHQLKIMKLISGEYDARIYLEKSSNS